MTIVVSTQDDKDWQQYRLTEEQLEQYWADGYLPNIKVLSEEQCDILLEDYKLFLVSEMFYYVYNVQGQLRR